MLANIGANVRIISLFCSLVSLYIILSSVDEDIYNSYVVVIAAFSYCAVAISSAIIPLKNLVDNQCKSFVLIKAFKFILIVQVLGCLLAYYLLPNDKTASLTLIILGVANILRLSSGILLSFEKYNTYHVLESAPSILFLIIILGLKYFDALNLTALLAAYAISQSIFFFLQYKFSTSEDVSRFLNADFFNSNKKFNFTDLRCDIKFRSFLRNYYSAYLISLSAATATSFPIFAVSRFNFQGNITEYSIINVLIQSIFVYISALFTPHLNKINHNQSGKKINFSIFIFLLFCCAIMYFFGFDLFSLLLKNRSVDILNSIVSGFIVLTPFMYVFIISSKYKNILLALNKAEIVAKIYICSLVSTAVLSILFNIISDLDIFYTFRSTYFFLTGVLLISFVSLTSSKKLDWD